MTQSKLLWHNPHFQFVKLFNWLGKVKNSSLKAFHCSFITLPYCPPQMASGQVSRECFLPERVSLDVPDLREVQYQEILDQWVLPLSEVGLMESETASSGRGEGQGCTRASFQSPPAATQLRTCCSGGCLPLSNSKFTSKLKHFISSSSGCRDKKL